MVASRKITLLARDMASAISDQQRWTAVGLADSANWLFAEKWFRRQHPVQR